MRSLRGIGAVVCITVAVLAGQLPGPAVGQPSPVPSDEAPGARQLRLADEDLDAGNFERAAASAASALRLDPSLTAALVVRGLALEGLGRLDEARSLLKVYADLRGTLALDARVAPALIRLDGAVSGAPSAPVERGPAAGGPALLLLAGGVDDQQGYRIAKPHLGAGPPVAVLRLEQLPGQLGLIVVGAEAERCTAGQSDTAPLIAAAQTALVNLDLAAAEAAADAARQALACGVKTPDEVEQWLRVAGDVALAQGDAAKATDLWVSLFTGFRRAGIGSDLDPRAKASQLGAYDAASSQEAVSLALHLPAGTSLKVDGADPGGTLARGLRFVSVEGADPGGFVLDVSGPVLIGSSALLRAAAVEDGASLVLTAWLAASAMPALSGFAADRALIVRPDGAVLELSPAGLRALEAASASVRAAVTPPPPGVPLAIGGGVAAGIGGILVGSSVSRGRGLSAGMETPSGWVDSASAYQAAQTGERAGWATVGVGSAVLVGGLVQTLIELGSRKKATQVAARP